MAINYGSIGEPRNSEDMSMENPEVSQNTPLQLSRNAKAGHSAAIVGTNGYGSPYALPAGAPSALAGE